MRSRDLFVAFLRAVGLCLLCAAVVVALAVLESRTSDSTLVSLLLLVGTTTLMGVWMLLGATTLTNRLRWPDEGAVGATADVATGTVGGDAAVAAEGAAEGGAAGTADEASRDGDGGPPTWILRGVEYFVAWTFTLRAVDAGADVVARLVAGSALSEEFDLRYGGQLGIAAASAAFAVLLFVRVARGARSAT